MDEELDTTESPLEEFTRLLETEFKDDKPGTPGCIALGDFVDQRYADADLARVRRNHRESLQIGLIAAAKFAEVDGRVSRGRTSIPEYSTRLDRLDTLLMRYFDPTYDGSEEDMRKVEEFNNSLQKRLVRLRDEMVKRS
ncbi:hypothetical protein KBC70_01530 [Candidatus Woesebacteria bacterium]|nr:hypothetical protein [Candidatus Woesebacteria bacterium]